MDKENKKLTKASSEVDDVDWGETAQRIPHPTLAPFSSTSL